MTVTGQPAAITRAYETAPQWRVWRCALRRGELDEAPILPGWLPSGPDWADVTLQTDAEEELGFTQDGRGYTLTFTVRDLNRDDWPDDAAVCLTARHWDGTGGWSPWDLVTWGYILGDGSQRKPALSGAVGTIRVGYAQFWDKAQVPALRYGRPNLATTATLVASSPVLADPLAEVGIEYISQADCGATNLTDENIDTVAVLDVVAGKSRPVLGNVTAPVIQRTYGSFTRGIAPGGQPRFIELAYSNDLAAGWGNFQNDGTIPALFEGNGTPFRNDDTVHTYTEAETAAPGNRVYVIEAKAQPAHPNQMQGIQWNFGSLGKRPLRVAFRYKAWETGSIGKTIHVTHDTGAVLQLTAQWQDYDVELDGAKNLHDTLVFRLQGGDNNSPELTTRTLFAFDDFHLYVGYSDMENQKDSGYKLSLAIDDGAGHEWVRRIAWDIDGNTEEWIIPPKQTVIITDNIAAFKAKFNPGSSQVWQLGTLFPQWYFGWEGGAAKGRIKLCYATSHVTDDYDHPDLITVHEVNFAVANGGAPWQEYQALARQSPLLTGLLSPEEHPRTGLMVGAYGTAHWWLDLGAYKPTYLTVAVAAGATSLNVDDPDEFPPSGEAVIAGDTFAYTGKSGRTLTGVSGVLAHDPGQATGSVVPKIGGVLQTAPLVDLVELRRKPGKCQILAGAVLYSDRLAPTDPSVPDTAGAKWERQADWELFNRWTFRQGDPDVITCYPPPPNAWVQMRHLCIVIDEMAQVGGIDQRAKLNEVVVRKYAPGSGEGFAGTQAGDLGRVLASLAAVRAGVPASKVFIVAATPPPIHDLAITPTTAGGALQSVAKLGLLQVRLDRWNRAYVDWQPNTAHFDRPEADWQWALADLRAEPTGDWAEAHQCSQVRVSAKELATYRLHEVLYPPLARPLGAIVELRDIIINTADDALTIARAEDRRANHRRTLALVAQACPWLEVHQRHILDLPGLDAGGGWSGRNVYVESFSVSVKLVDGVPVWATTIATRELSVT
jgi:hypothetical protein